MPTQMVELTGLQFQVAVEGAGPAVPIPTVSCPTMGVWSSGDLDFLSTVG